MFHPSEAGRDVDMQREGSRGQAKRLFLSDVVSFLTRIFRSPFLSDRIRPNEAKQKRKMCDPGIKSLAIYVSVLTELRIFCI